MKYFVICVDQDGSKFGRLFTDKEYAEDYFNQAQALGYDPSMMFTYILDDLFVELYR